PSRNRLAHRGKPRIASFKLQVQSPANGDVGCLRDAEGYNFLRQVALALLMKMSGSYRSLLSLYRTSLSSSSYPTSQFVRWFHSTPLTMPTHAAFRIPNISNEPNKHYGKGSPDREGLAAAVAALQAKAPLEIPLVVSGKSVKTSTILTQNNPSAHATTIA